MVHVVQKLLSCVKLKLWIRNTFETKYPSGHTKSDNFIEITRQCKSVSTNIVEKHLLVLLQSCFMPSRGSDTTWWGGGDAFCFYSALESSQQKHHQVSPVLPWQGSWIWSEIFEFDFFFGDCHAKWQTVPWSRFPSSIICHFLALLTAQWEEHKEMKNLMSPRVTHANISQVLTPMENDFL